MFDWHKSYSHWSKINVWEIEHDWLFYASFMKIVEKFWYKSFEIMIIIAAVTDSKQNVWILQSTAVSWYLRCEFKIDTCTRSSFVVFTDHYRRHHDFSHLLFFLHLFRLYIFLSRRFVLFISTLLVRLVPFLWTCNLFQINLFINLFFYTFYYRKNMSESF